MEKNRNLLPPEVEPPLKQHQWEAEQEEKEDDQASVFGASCSPAFRSSMRRSSSTPPASDDLSISRTLFEAALKETELEEAAEEAAFAATSCYWYEYPEPHTPFSILSIPAITEEDGGTSGARPAYNYERYESCFIIAGADYCVIAADFTRGHNNISKLSRKSVMASFGFQADVKALEEALSAENLRYECKHNKPMSCPEMHRLLDGFEKRHPNLDFIVLGGLDSEGKGRVFKLYGPGTATTGSDIDSDMDSDIDSEVGHPGSILIVPPILKYKLPAEDVLARLSETEAVELAKNVFKSATNTGDKLEIFVLNASGLRHDHVDLRKEKNIKK